MEEIDHIIINMFLYIGVILCVSIAFLGIWLARRDHTPWRYVLIAYSFNAIIYLWSLVYSYRILRDHPISGYTYVNTIGDVSMLLAITSGLILRVISLKKLGRQL